MLGTVHLEYIVASVGGSECYGSPVGSSCNGSKRNGVVSVSTIHSAKVELLIKGFFAELKHDGACHTRIVQGVESRGDVREVTAHAGTDSVGAAAETYIESTDNGVVSRHGITRN